MSPWIEGDPVRLAAEHNAGRAALQLVHTLGIEGAELVDVETFEALPQNRRAALTNFGGTMDQRTSLLRLPERPEP